MNPRLALALTLAPTLLALSPVASSQGFNAQAAPGNPWPALPALPPCPSCAWQISGNTGTNPALHFVGTKDAAPLSIRTNNWRAMRYEYAANASFRSINVLGGTDLNAIAPGIIGATIAGGGQDFLVGTDYPNLVFGDFGTVGGGGGNTAGNQAATVAGGGSNTASGVHASILGGVTNNASGNQSTIGGGSINTAGGLGATVPGGYLNDAGTDYSTVGGGVGNVIGGGNVSTISGGEQNSALGQHASIGGGLQNNVFGNWGTIGGGYINQIGGIYATVGGGRENGATGDDSTIGGGHANQASFPYATIGGGEFNGVHNHGATIAGGVLGQVTARGGTIGGGVANTVSGAHGTVPGGDGNLAQGQLSFAAGQFAQAQHDGAFVWADNSNLAFSSNAANEFSVRASGGTCFFSDSSATTGAYLAPGAGTWTSCSDRDLKQAVEAVDGREVLARLETVPMATWSYTSQDESIRHMGPMAQDFYAAFGLGLGERTIDTIDADGVALAAIQGLNALVEEQAALIEALTARVAALEDPARR